MPIGIIFMPIGIYKDCVNKSYNASIQRRLHYAFTNMLTWVVFVLTLPFLILLLVFSMLFSKTYEERDQTSISYENIDDVCNILERSIGEKEPTLSEVEWYDFLDEFDCPHLDIDMDEMSNDFCNNIINWDLGDLDPINDKKLYLDIKNFISKWREFNLNKD